LTHALSGALLACATAARISRPDQLPLRTRILAGFTAAAVPDIDFALRVFGILRYLNEHQGLTHSLVMLPLWAWLLAWLFSRISKGRYRWQAFYGICAGSIAIHIGADLITAYGTKLLAPLSDRRFSLALSFVIDPYFSTIIILGLLGAGLSPQRRLIPIAAFAILAAYIGFQAELRQRALDAARFHALGSSMPAAPIHALPQPFSPFKWMLLIETKEGYDVATIDLLTQRSSGNPDSQASAAWTSYHLFGDTPEQTALARTAWKHPALAPFREFAVFPALDSIESGPNQTCAWFVDLRFLLPGSAPSFRYGLCRDTGGNHWRLERKPGAYWID
jgi:inner membrane protein